MEQGKKHTTYTIRSNFCHITEKPKWIIYIIFNEFVRRLKFSVNVKLPNWNWKPEKPPAEIAIRNNNCIFERIGRKFKLEIHPILIRLQVFRCRNDKFVRQTVRVCDDGVWWIGEFRRAIFLWSFLFHEPIMGWQLNYGHIYMQSFVIHTNCGHSFWSERESIVNEMHNLCDCRCANAIHMCIHYTSSLFSFRIISARELSTLARKKKQPMLLY